MVICVVVAGSRSPESEAVAMVAAAASSAMEEGRDGSDEDARRWVWRA